MMRRSQFGMCAFAFLNILYMVLIGAFASEYIFNLLVYFVWTGLAVGFAYFAGMERVEKLKLPENANKVEKETNNDANTS